MYQNYSQIPNIKPAAQIAEDTNQWKFGVRSKMIVRPGLVSQAEHSTPQISDDGPDLDYILFLIFSAVESWTVSQVKVHQAKVITAGYRELSVPSKAESCTGQR